MRIVSAFSSAIALLNIAALGACAARTPREPSGYVNGSNVDTLAARLAELELRRISVLASAPTDAGAVRNADTQIAALRERTYLLPNRDVAERIITERVMRALEARESTVTTRLRELRLVYTDKYPTVRQAVEEERLLREREAELRRPGH